MQVEKEAVHDLLNTMPWVPRRVNEILETLWRILPLLETGDEARAIRATVNIEIERPDYDAEFWPADIIAKQVRCCITELDNNCDKRAVLKAALGRTGHGAK